MSGTPTVLVRPVGAGDRAWVRRTLVRHWGTTAAARHGELVEALDLPGFVALVDGRRTGLALVTARQDELEVVSLTTSRRRAGVGRALVEACAAHARSRGCRRVWLTTTNDNVGALAFYQRVGMDLCAFRRHGVRASRAVKPSIPLLGTSGVPIDHELDLEVLLAPVPEMT